jgi:Flp pilus assembly protein TadD
VNEALSSVERALSLDQYSTARWNNLGGILATLGRREEAKTAYSKALQLEPENAGAMVGLAQLLMDEGKLKDAKTWCELAIFWRPEKPAVLKIASQCFLRCEDTTRAKPLLERLVSIEPGDATAWYNMALCYGSLGEAERYVHALREAARLNPKDGQALNFLVQALVDIGRVDEAKAVCERLEGLEGWEIVGACKHAQLLAGEGAGMSAYVLLNKWTSKYERSAALWFTMAVVLSQAPEQYRLQALTAAKNALLCYNEDSKQLTPENYRALKELTSNLSR